MALELALPHQTIQLSVRAQRIDRHRRWISENSDTFPLQGTFYGAIKPPALLTHALPRTISLANANSWQQDKMSLLYVLSDGCSSHNY